MQLREVNVLNWLWLLGCLVGVSKRVLRKSQLNIVLKSSNTTGCHIQHSSSENRTRNIYSDINRQDRAFLIK